MNHACEKHANRSNVSIKFIEKISFAELEDSRNGIVSNRVKYFQYVLANRTYFESNKFKNEFNI